MTLKEMIKVMKAAERGEQIQFKAKNPSDTWDTVAKPSWDWSQWEYRIAPKPDPYAELKAALQDPTKVVWLTRTPGEQIKAAYISYKFPPDQYEIRDKLVADPHTELKAAAQDPTKVVIVRFKAGHVRQLELGECFDPAEHADYEIRDKPDPFAKLKEAAQDPTMQVRCTHPACGLLGMEWRSNHKWAWNYDPEDYEIRDKPKPMKKVKLLGWLTPDGKYEQYASYRAFEPDWKRAPGEDKEIEVEE